MRYSGAAARGGSRSRACVCVGRGPVGRGGGELSQVTYRHVFVVPRRLYPAFAQRVAEQGAPCREEAGHRDLRLIVCEPVP